MEARRKSGGSDKVKTLINQFQKVRLRTGDLAVVVEILEQNRAFLVDIQKGEDSFETDEIRDCDIESVFIEVEQPYITV